MNNYAFQFKLHTLALCAVKDGKNNTSFEYAGMKYSHWDFNPTEGHKPGAWFITTELQATSMREASKDFFTALNDLIPKIALIAQCYTEYLNESFLIHRLDTDIAFFRYSAEDSAVPLWFDENSLKALDSFRQANLPNEFFYYWNDMLNTPSYPAKLLLICSALEALGKALGKKRHEKASFQKEVLGDELYKKAYENQDRGIRHRLTHGDYFSLEDDEDYVTQIYTKIIQYLNDILLKGHPIQAVVHPQRHPWGNKKGWKGHLKKARDTSFDLKEMIKECDKDFSGLHARFEMPTEEEIKNL